MQGDDFSKDCDALSKYMSVVLSHPYLGASPLLTEFLETPEAPTRQKQRKGLLEGMKHTLLDSTRSGRRLSAAAVGAAGGSSIRDVDETFAKEREWAAQYGTHQGEYVHVTSK